MVHSQKRFEEPEAKQHNHNSFEIKSSKKKKKQEEEDDETRNYTSSSTKKGAITKA
jgi:hypothetical protein